MLFKNFKKNREVFSPKSYQFFHIISFHIFSAQHPKIGIKRDFLKHKTVKPNDRGYVDDTLTIMPNIETASNFLDRLNKAHSSIKFTIESKCSEMLPFLGIQLLNRSPQIETKV